MRLLGYLIRGGRSVALALCLTVAANAAAATEFGRYQALVVGNNEYKNLPKLQTAVSDAAAVAELLKLKYGFEVELILNATRNDILKAINRLRAELTEKDRLLIYYAGHGELDRQTQTGYWLPVDAEPEDDTNWIANESLTRHFKAMSARHVMVVADSCYSGALVRAANVAPKSGAERDEWVRRMAAKRSRTALVSGGLEPVADAGKNGHSVFANAFLDALRENREVIDGERLFQSIRTKVVLNADQTPQYSDMRRADHEGGDFLFAPTDVSKETVAAPAAAPVPVAPKVDPRTIELAYWDSIKDSREPAILQTYLEKYPTGEFAGLAKVRIDVLRRSEETAQQQAAQQRATASREAALEQERAAWQAVSGSQSIAVVETFLQQFPDGANAPLARIRMAELRSAEQRLAEQHRREEAERQARDKAAAQQLAMRSAGPAARENANATNPRSGSETRVAAAPTPGMMQNAIGNKYDGEWKIDGGSCFDRASFYGRLSVRNGIYSLKAELSIPGGSGGGWTDEQSAELGPDAKALLWMGGGGNRKMGVFFMFPGGAGSDPLVKARKCPVDVTRVR
jgi:hypothetical protein